MQKHLHGWQERERERERERECLHLPLCTYTYVCVRVYVFWHTCSVTLRCVAGLISRNYTPSVVPWQSLCWVPLNTTFCNYKSVIILLVFSFPPGAELSAKHRHSAVLQLHLHTQPHGHPPTHKRVPTHTHPQTHSGRHTGNQPWWLLLLTLTLIETLCTKAWRCSATAVMMDQQSKNDVEKGLVVHLWGHSCVEARTIPKPHMTPSVSDLPLPRVTQWAGDTVFLNRGRQIRHSHKYIYAVHI